MYLLPPAIPDVLASFLFFDSRNQELSLGASRTRSQINPKFINGVSFYLLSKYESLRIRDRLAFLHGLKIVVQSLSRIWLFVTPWTAAHKASLSFTISLSLLKLLSIELVMQSNHLILCCPLLLLPSIFPSIRIFSSESALHIRWLKYWSFGISPSNEYLGLIFFRIDWFDLFAVHGPLEKGMANHFSILASRTPWTVWIGLKMEGSISRWVKTWPLESCPDSTAF